jgi:hypothetical protein
MNPEPNALPLAGRVIPYSTAETVLPALVPFRDAERPRLALEVAIPDNLASLRDFICAAAEALQVNPEAVASLAMGICSLAAARSYEVEPQPGWREPAPLWFVVLADPGERKSALLALLTEPLHRWQIVESGHLRESLARNSEARKAVEARLNGVRSRLGKAKQNEIPSLEKEAQKLGVQFAAMDELQAPALLTADATPEAVRDLLARNGEKLGLVSAETDAGQLLGARYSEGPNLSLFLSAHAGDPAPVHRVGKDIPLDRPALAVVLFVQPEALSAVLRDPAAIGRGLTSRMLLVRPDSRMGSRELTPPPVSAHLQEWWAEAIRRILAQPWPGRVVLSNAGGVQRSSSPALILTLAPEAREALCALRADVEKRLNEAGELRPISGFASKLPGAMARLALGMQVLQDPTATVIDGPTMRAACAWAPFLIGHFKSAAGSASESKESRHARRLVSALRRHRCEIVTAREAFRLIDGAPGMETMHDFVPVAEELIERGYLIPIQAERSTGGRPSERYSVHPGTFT